MAKKFFESTPVQLSLLAVPKRIFGHFPWISLLLVGVWMFLGLLNLYSATYRINEGTASSLFYSQLVWMALGLVGLFAMTLADYHVLSRFAYLLYGLSLVLLALVFVWGKSVAGQKNWLSLAGFSFQPSEFAKLTLLFALARLYAKQALDQGLQSHSFLKALGLFLPPFLLTLLQKDLGGSLFFVLLFSTLTFFMKIPWRWVLILLGLGALLTVGAYFFVLKPYQKDRIQTFLNPEAQARGKGYHLVQSKIAAGSGGLLGKGYLKGYFNKLKYLPEKHTDFIFPVFAEEWGFLGCFLALVVMASFLLLGLECASQAKDPFAALLALGLVSLLFWNVFINLGGVLALIPLTGVPLPLFSYGGSSSLTMLMAIGLLFNVRMRRFVF